MSVRPTANQTRTPDGTGIIAAPRRPHQTQRRSLDPAADPNAIAADQLDLDQLAPTGRRGCGRLIWRYRHPSVEAQPASLTRHDSAAAKRKPVRIHVVTPRHQRHDDPGVNDAATIYR